MVSNLVDDCVKAGVHSPQLGVLVNATTQLSTLMDLLFLDQPTCTCPGISLDPFK